MKALGTIKRENWTHKWPCAEWTLIVGHCDGEDCIAVIGLPSRELRVCFIAEEDRWLGKPPLNAAVRVLDMSFFRKIITRHDTGLGEAYMDEDYEVRCLPACLPKACLVPACSTSAALMLHFQLQASGPSLTYAQLSSMHYACLLCCIIHALSIASCHAACPQLRVR